MSATDSRVSFTELQQWPEDGRRYELYDGEVIVVPSPFLRHQRVTYHLGQVLGEYEQVTGGLVFDAPIDIVLSEYDVIQPDLVFFRQERRHLIDMWQATRVPPDLAVEVLSRSTERRDRGRKMALLAQSRVPEYWIVDPKQNTLEIYVLTADGYRLVGTHDDDERVQSHTLPNLSFGSRRIFAE